MFGIVVVGGCGYGETNSCSSPKGEGGGDF